MRNGAPGTAMAHGVWFARRSDRIQLVCGEGWKDNAYDPDGLTTIKGYDADYADVAVEPIKGEDYLYIEPSDDLAAVYLEMDYGYWSNNADGEWIPKPMDEVGGLHHRHARAQIQHELLQARHRGEGAGRRAYQFVPSVDPSTLNVGRRIYRAAAQ